MQVLREDGSSDPAHDPRLSDDRVFDLYRDMLRARALRAIELPSRDADASDASEARGTPNPANAGDARPRPLDEAVTVGAAAALREQDWLFAAPGEIGGALARGVAVDAVAHHAWGTARDGAKGHDAPFHVMSRAARVVSATIANGAHLTHAAGLAWGARIRRDDVVALATFGDATVLAGEFHNGVNFAGVFKAPVVFVCANASADLDLDAKALAYGVAVVGCDGADLLAVVAVVRDAVRRAAAGGGPTVVDARIASAAARAWDDPVARVQRHIESRAGGAAKVAALASHVQAEVRAAVAEAERAPKPDGRSMFENVYAKAVYAKPLPRSAPSGADS